jgi:hypothetical protein
LHLEDFVACILDSLYDSKGELSFSLLVQYWYHLNLKHPLVHYIAHSSIFLD